MVSSVAGILIHDIGCSLQASHGKEINIPVKSEEAMLNLRSRLLVLERLHLNRLNAHCAGCSLQIKVKRSPQSRIRREVVVKLWMGCVCVNGLEEK